MTTVSSREVLLLLASRLRLDLVTIARSYTYCGQHFQAEQGSEFLKLAIESRL